MTSNRLYSAITAAGKDHIRKWLSIIAAALAGIDRRSHHLKLVRVRDLDSGFTCEGDITLMQLTTEQKVKITFGRPVSAHGNPADVQEGSVVIRSMDASVRVEQDPADPFSATVFGVEKTPDVTKPGAILIEADADTGDGVETIQGVEPVIVAGPKAAGFGPATLGTPEDK